MGLFDKLRMKSPENTMIDTPTTVEDDTKHEFKEIEGKIIKIDYDKGFGFITSKELKFIRIFFHWTALSQNTLRFQQLKKGMKCRFIPHEVPEKGYRATKIIIVD